MVVLHRLRHVDDESLAVVVQQVELALVKKTMQLFNVRSPLKSHGLVAWVVASRTSRLVFLLIRFKIFFSLLEYIVGRK